MGNPPFNRFPRILSARAIRGAEDRIGAASGWARSRDIRQPARAFTRREEYATRRAAGAYEQLVYRTARLDYAYLRSRGRNFDDTLGG